MTIKVAVTTGIKVMQYLIDRDPELFIKELNNKERFIDLGNIEKTIYVNKNSIVLIIVNPTNLE